MSPDFAQSLFFLQLSTSALSYYFCIFYEILLYAKKWLKWNKMLALSSKSVFVPFLGYDLLHYYLFFFSEVLPKIIELLFYRSIHDLCSIYISEVVMFTLKHPYSALNDWRLTIIKFLSNIFIILRNIKSHFSL